MPKINEARFKRDFEKSFAKKAKSVVKKSRIIEKYLAGIPLKQIASESKLTARSIGNVIQNHPKKEEYMAQRKNRCAQILCERNKQIVKLTQAGVHSVDIAREFKLTQRQVQTILHKSGVKSKGKKRLSVLGVTRQKAQQQRKKQILIAFMQGAPIGNICKQYTITRRRFFQILAEQTLDKRFNVKLNLILEQNLRQALGLFSRGVALQTIAERVNLPVGYLHQSLSKIRGHKKAKQKHNTKRGQWARYDKESMLQHAKFDEANWLQIIGHGWIAKEESQTHKARVKITEILVDLRHEKIVKTDLFHRVKKFSFITPRLFSQALAELTDIGIIDLTKNTIHIRDEWKIN